MARGPGKGVSNNPKGKPKGASNKTTKELKEFYVALLGGETERIKLALKDLYDKDKKAYMMAIDKISNKVIANKKDITSDDKPVPNITINEITRDTRH